MIMDRAVLARSSAFMLKKIGTDFLQDQARCGCDATLWPQAVALEPEYVPLDRSRDKSPGVVTYRPTPPLQRLSIWISPDHVFNWERAELFIQQLSALKALAGFEIVGNCQKIALNLLCTGYDRPIVETAFAGRLRNCRLSPDTLGGLSCGHTDQLAIRDYFPTPPFYRLLTRNDELKITPFEVLVSALARIEPRSIGIYQVVFKPVEPEHNWHENIKRLFDMEYSVKLADNPGLAVKYPQQIPSAPLSSMASFSECKAHNDKSLFAVAVRMAVVGDNAQQHILSLGSFTSLFQHGGNHLNALEKTDYLTQFNCEHILKMLEGAIVYRPGFLLNSSELSGFVHVPPDSIFEGCTTKFNSFEMLSEVPPKLQNGLEIGSVSIPGSVQKVCLDPRLRSCHCHLIGKPIKGKSTLMENMVISDIKAGEGVAVIDPHGDLAEKLLCLIPQDCIEKVIYIDFSDPNWIPIWNPLRCTHSNDIDRITANLIGVLKSFITGWGDRMEHLLSHSIYGLMHLPGSSLLDVANILRYGNESKDLISSILEVVDTQESRRFWQNDFKGYSAADLGPPKHKLSKFLLGGTVAHMLSQPDSSFSFKQIMDNGMILIVNLSELGSGTCNVLGAFLVALMHITALGRNKIPEDRRRPFHIYLDEAHRFVTKSLEKMIAEMRKYNVDLTLAHQYFKQFTPEVADALCIVGTTIAFNVDFRDAISLSKAFQKKVTPEAFGELDRGEAFVRCDSQVVKINTPGPLDIGDHHFYQEIIDYSHRHYYKHISQVKQIIARRRDRFNKPYSDLSVPPDLPNDNADQVKERYYYERL